MVSTLFKPITTNINYENHSLPWAPYALTISISINLLNLKTVNKMFFYNFIFKEKINDNYCGFFTVYCSAGNALK